jgi:signal transduction histidine kinase
MANGAMEGEPAAGELTIASRVTGQRVEIEVGDTGPGISSDVLPQVFEPLFSTKQFGTGLGLSIARRIMEQHGGGLEIDSKEGQGTWVTLWLPRPPRTQEASKG